jgi:hypothetical protein
VRTPRRGRVVAFSHVGVDGRCRRFGAVHVDEDIDGVIVDEFGIAKDAWGRARQLKRYNHGQELVEFGPIIDRIRFG